MKILDAVEAVDYAMGRVNIVFHCSDETEGVLCWAIWDRNKDTDDRLGIVHVGLPVKKRDRLRRPYGEIHVRYRKAVALAAIEATGACVVSKVSS
jgi:hypothetical protein